MRFGTLSRRIYLRAGNFRVAQAPPIPQSILLESSLPGHAAHWWWPVSGKPTIQAMAERMNNGSTVIERISASSEQDWIEK
jgi:hypothetical protein